MGAHRSASEIQTIIRNFYDSNLTIGEYGRRNNIPPSTLTGWLTKYKIAMGDLVCPTGFSNITEPLKQEIMCPSINESLPATNNSTRDNIINASVSNDNNNSSNKNQIRIVKDGITMVFDVSLLKQVMEVLS